MGEHPLVSVVVVTFDRLWLLGRALESIRRQTWPADSIEVVLVNDAGVDPVSVVSEFEDSLRIVRVDHERNQGIAAALNSGIRAATGKYVCFLADDDLYYPRHVEALATRAEELGGEALVYSDAVKVLEDDAGQDIERGMYAVRADFSRTQLLVQNYIPGHCFIVPRVVFDEVGLFDETFEALEDWEMWLRASARYPVERMLEVTAEYRWRQHRHDNSTTRERPRHYYNLDRLYDKHPVEESELRQARRRHLEANRALLMQHAFDLSILVVSDGDLQLVMKTLESVVRTLGAEGSYEVLIHLPRSDQADALMAELEGDVMFVFGEAEAADAWDVLVRKAAGRRLVRLEAGAWMSERTPITDAPWAAVLTGAPAPR